MSLFPRFELVTNRHGNNHDNHRDIVHVILTEDLVDDDAMMMVMVMVRMMMMKMMMMMMMMMMMILRP